MLLYHILFQKVKNGRPGNSEPNWKDESTDSREDDENIPE